MKLAIAVAAVVAAQAVIYYAILDRTVGSSSWLGGAPAGRTALRVAILRSDAGAKLNREHPELYFDLAKQWESILGEAHVSYRVINDKEIARGLAKSADVLVLPWAMCLDDAQRNAIQSYVESGNGLVLSGATGVRNADCSWKGWDSLSRLTGLRNPSASSAPAPLLGAYTGGNFYSGSVPAGYQLSLANQEVVMGAAAKPDVYAADYRLHPLEAAPGGTLALHGIRGRGRFVWFGFPETMPMKDESGRGVLNAYLLSAVRWAGRQPVAAVANWPKAAPSAVVVAARVADPKTAQSTIAALRDARVRATFFLDAKTAAQAPELVRSLAGMGEIASSCDTPDSFADQTASRQTARLADARRRLQNDSGLSLAGFAPPDSLWDNRTVSALRDAGFAYYVDRVGATRAVPELIAAPAVSFLPVRQVPLARLEAPFADDFEAMAESPSDAPTDRLWNDFRIVESLGGAYTLSFRTDLLGAPENAPALQALLRKIKERGAWMATGSELAEWWIRHERVRTDVRQVNDRRIRLAVSNSGSRAISDTSVYVFLPGVPARLRVIPALLGSGIPHYEVSRDGVLRLDFPKLAAAAAPSHFVQAGPEARPAPLVMHFYYWNDRLADDSLRAHYRQIGLLSPVWLEVDKDGNLVTTIDKRTAAWAAANDIRVMPVVVNRGFLPETAAAGTGAARERLIAALIETARRHRFCGLQLDFEGLRPADRASYAEFAERLAAALHRRGMQLSVAVPAPLAAAMPPDSAETLWKASEQSAAFDYERLGRAADFVSLMAYDEYTSPEEPGPVAGLAWVEACVRQTLDWTPAAKVMLGVPLYHRHWAAKKVSEGPYAAAAALALAAKSEIRLDATHQEATFQYSDSQGDHVVWLETADSLSRRTALASKYGLRGISAWRLGQEDPAAWGTAFLQKPEKQL